MNFTIELNNTLAVIEKREGKLRAQILEANATLPENYSLKLHSSNDPDKEATWKHDIKTFHRKVLFVSKGKFREECDTRAAIARELELLHNRIISNPEDKISAQIGEGVYSIHFYNNRYYLEPSEKTIVEDTIYALFIESLKQGINILSIHVDRWSNTI